MVDGLKGLDNIAELAGSGYEYLRDSLKNLTAEEIIAKTATLGLSEAHQAQCVEAFAVDAANYQTAASMGTLTASTTGATAATSGLKLAMKGLWASLKPFLGVAAVAAAIAGIAWAIDEAYVSAEEQAEKNVELKASYDELSGELEMIASRIAEIKTRMDELNAVGSLSLTDQQELENLKQENKELEYRKTLLEADTEKASGELTQGIDDWWEKEFQKGSYKNITQNPDGEGFKDQTTGSIYTEGVNAYATKEEQFKAQIERAKELIALGEKRTVQDEEELRLIREATTATANEIATKIDGYEAVTEEQKAQKALWESYIADAAYVKDPAKYQTEQFEKAWNSKEISYAKTKLTELSKAGELTVDKFNEIINRSTSELANKLSYQEKEIVRGYGSIIGEIESKGIDLTQTVFGNIDTNNRQILEWTDENIARFSDELMSHGISTYGLKGTVSTVLGGTENFEGVEIAFSPILQTENGPVLLSSDSISDYIYSLIDIANADGQWTTEELLSLDAAGIVKDGQLIKGVIADVGETALLTGEAMHYVGDNGAYIESLKDIVAVANKYGVTVEELVDLDLITPSELVLIQQAGLLVDGASISVEALVEQINSLNKAKAEAEQLEKTLVGELENLPIDKLEEYVALIKSGEIDKDNLSSYEDLNKILEDLGLSGEEAFEKLQEYVEDFDLSIDLMSNVQDSYDVLEDIKKEFEETKRIGLDSLKSIAAKYPELNTTVALYNQGLITGEQLLEQLASSYNKDANEYRHAMLEKVGYDATFFAHVVANNETLFTELGKAYQGDLSNYKELAKAKAEVDSSLITELAKAWSQYYDVIPGEGGMVAGFNFEGDESLDQMQIDKDTRNKLTNLYNQQALLNKAIDAAAFEIVLPDFDNDTDDTDGSGGDSKSSSEFDYIPRKIEAVQEAYSKLIAEADNAENTYANQLNYLNSAIDKQQELIDLQREAEGVYLAEWNAKSSGLTDEQRNLIMNGGFKIEEYSGDNAEQMTEADNAWKLYSDMYKSRLESEKELEENERDRYAKRKEWQESEIDKLLEKGDIERESYEKNIDALNEAKRLSQALEDEMRKNAEQAKSVWDNVKSSILDGDIAKIINGEINLDYYKDNPEYQATIEEGMEAYEEYQDSEEELNESIEKNAETAKRAFEKAIEVVDAQKDLVNSNISSTEKTIEVIEAIGGTVTASMYEDMIAENEDLVDLYEEQIDLIEERIDAVEPESAEYYQLKAQLQDCKNALKDCTIQTQEWIEAIKKLPINRLNTFVTNLGYIRNTLQNFTDEQAAHGLSPTVEQYEKFIEFNNIENDKLLEEKQHWIDLAKTYEYGSEKYQDAMSNIDRIDNQISQNTQNSIENAYAILERPLKDLENAKSALDRAESILDSRMAYDEAQGKKPTKEQYRLKQNISSTRYNLAMEEVDAQKQLMNVYEEGSDKWLEAKANHDAALATANNALVEMYQNASQAVHDQLDAIDEAYEKITDYGDALQRLNDIKESKGQDLTVDDYKEVINATFASIDGLQRQRNEYVKQLDGLEEGSEMYKTMQDKIKNCDEEMANLIKDIHAFNDALLQMPLDQIDKLNDKLSKISSPIQDKMGDFDSAMSAVNYVIDQEIDNINEEIDATNELYDAKIDPLNDELELLRKTNEERDIQLALEKAQYDLERARNQKTNMVIRDGKIVYEADQDALRAANESMADAQYNKAVHDLEVQIENLEKERDELIKGYEEQIDNLNDIKDLWAEIVESIEAAANIEIATSIFGEGWIDKVLSGDDSGLRDIFKNGYETLFGENEEIKEQQASNDRVKEAIESITDAYKRGDITKEEAQEYLKTVGENAKDGYTADEYLQDQGDFKGVSFVSLNDDVDQDIGTIIANAISNLDEVDKNRDKAGETETTLEENIGNLATAIDGFEDELSTLNSTMSDFKTTVEDINKKIPSWEDFKDSLGLEAITFNSDTISDSISIFDANMQMIEKNTLKWDELNTMLDQQIATLEENNKELSEKQSSKGTSTNSSSSSNTSSSRSDTNHVATGVVNKYGRVYNYENGKLVHPVTGKDLGVSNYKEFMEEYEDDLKAGTYHDGIEKGFVKSSNSSFERFIKSIAVDPLRSDEIIAKLQHGEGVFTQSQMRNVVENSMLLGKYASQLESSGAISRGGSSQVIDFSIGEMHLHDVQDVDGFAKALDQTFELKLSQNFSKYFK